MMKTSTWTSKMMGLAAVCFSSVVLAQAVPEPGLVLYGKVWNNGQILASGQLTWSYVSTTGTAVQATVPLRQIRTADGDTYSYRVMFPAASATAGVSLDAGTLPVTDEAVTYTRSATLDGQPLRLDGDRTQDIFSAAVRGKLERLDLAAQGSVIPTYAIAGSVSYAGRQPGAILVQVFDNGVFATPPVRTTVAVPRSGAEFSLTGLPAGTYYVRAFKDYDGNGQLGAAEAVGVCNANPLLLPPDAATVNITLIDPDSDHDGLPDWWELAYLGKLDYGPNDDVDGDGKTNAAEYVAGESPSDVVLQLLPGWNLISMPVEPPDATTATLFAGSQILPQAITWDGEGYREVQDLVPKAGYWVFVPGPKDGGPVLCEVSGTPVLDGAVVLPPGWSLIGPVADCPVPVDKQIAGIWRWDVASSSYRVPEGNLEAGEGYWIYVLAGDNCTINTRAEQNTPRR